MSKKCIDIIYFKTCNLEVQPAFLVGWFTNHHFIVRINHHPKGTWHVMWGMNPSWNRLVFLYPIAAGNGVYWLAMQVMVYTGFLGLWKISSRLDVSTAVETPPFTADLSIHQRKHVSCILTTRNIIATFSSTSTNWLSKAKQKEKTDQIYICVYVLFIGPKTMK